MALTIDRRHSKLCLFSADRGTHVITVTVNASVPSGSKAGSARLRQTSGARRLCYAGGRNRERALHQAAIEIGMPLQHFVEDEVPRPRRCRLSS